MTVLYVVSTGRVPLLQWQARRFRAPTWGRLTLTPLEIATMFAYALIPLGFAMWLAHYSFHFFTGYLAVIPTTQRFAVDQGWAFLGSPDWSCWVLCSGGRLAAADCRSCFSISVCCFHYTRVIGSLSTDRAHLPLALKAFVPWAMLILLLFAVGNLDLVSTDADAWNDAEGVVKLCLAGSRYRVVLMAWLALSAGAERVLADGGAVAILRSGVEAGSSRYFTTPNPLRAGLADVSVLVQEADSGQSDHWTTRS